MFDIRINYHRIFSANKSGVDFFVGDIHGEYDLFINTLKSVGFSQANGDRVFSVGDIINRGPDSQKCIELLNEPWFFAVIGNHEDMLMSLIRNPASRQIKKILRKVGGEWIDECMEQTPKTLNFLISTVYANMYLAFSVKTSHGEIGVIHANSPSNWNLIRNQNLLDSQERDCLWQAKNFYLDNQQNILNIDAVVSGHINSNIVEIKANQIWIDTLLSTGRITILTSDQILRKISDGKT